VKNKSFLILNDFFMTDITPFIKSSWDYIRYICYKQVSFNIEEGELLFSQVLEKIALRSHTFEGDAKGFINWAHVIARNESINYFRKERKDLRVEISDCDYVSMQPSLEDKMQIADIMYTVDKKCSERLIKVFYHNLIEGNTLKDTAKHLNIPVGSVKSAVWVLRKFLSNKSNIIKAGSIIKPKPKKRRLRKPRPKLDKSYAKQLNSGATKGNRGA
jgi:RNA polymerase sigma factor (sigma-70 family)